MKTLVVGGFGFIGARIAVALHSAGHSVVLGTRSKRAVPDWLPQAAVQVLDWDSRSALQEACTGIDAVVHAAGMNAGQCASDPVAALQVNGVATARLVEAAASASVSRFFYFSTAHVYSSPLVGEIDELSCPSNVHPYASSHRAGEYALLHALSRSRLAGCVLRLSNGFGPPISTEADCWMLLVNDLCRQAATTGKLVLQSSGAQMRDFVPLTNVCEGVVELLKLPVRSLPPVLNVGSGNSLSVLAMAHLVQERCTAILGVTPSIEVGKRAEAAHPLRFTSLHEGLLGVAVANPVPEVDQLLAFCRSHFIA